MAETIAVKDNAQLEDWPLRPFVLGAVLAICGLLIHFVTDGMADEEPWRAAAAAFLGFGGLALAFTLDRRGAVSSAIFALAIGLIMAGIAWQLVAADGHRAGLEFTFAAGCFFCLLALPLFQAGFHRTRLNTSYKLTHYHVWADAISGGGALAFTGLSWALLALLNALFGLVGVEIINDLMNEEWFGWTYSGGVFGAGLGVIRNNLKVVGALQKVVMLVFAILAVPFAAALLIFLVILLASGGEALWEATDAATPILLACGAGAFVLANAIIRDDDEERSANRVMQWAALLLSLLILPLCGFAALSMGIRVDQHGFSPERIWALIAIAVAVAYGVAAWIAIVRGRISGWMAKLRAANLHLAAGVCVLALVLALPVWDFGAMSAKNQIARLEAGKVSAKDFDYTALRWDFGDAGREALAELSAGEGEVAELAAKAEAQTERVWDWERARVAERFDGELRVESDDPELRALVLAYLEERPWECSDYCIALDLGMRADGRRQVALVENRFSHSVVALPQAVGDCVDGSECVAQSAEEAAEQAERITGPINADTKVELREMTQRYIVIDGVPIDRSVEQALPDNVENLRISQPTSDE